MRVILRALGLLLSVLGIVCPISNALAVDRLVIISPHRKSIQQEFIPVFKKYYKSKYGSTVDVEWLDQGGTSDDLRFIQSRFANNPVTAGVDVFWGGGEPAFLKLDSEGLLEPLKLPAGLAAQIGDSIAGTPTHAASKTWYASAISSFGIFYNKRLITMLKMPVAKTWEDLGHEVYKDNVTLTDPRRSGSTMMMNMIILQSMGWQKGWRTLARIAANARRFAHSSSDPIKGVVSGDSVAALAIDFYANSRIAELGEKNLGFVLPEGKTAFSSDPVAMLKGAPNPSAAKRFVEFVLGPVAQKLLILPVGVAGGPKYNALGRMSINKDAYTQSGDKFVGLNPFKIPPVKFRLDYDVVARRQSVISDMVGALLVDNHEALKEGWHKATNSKIKDAMIAPVVDEKELDMLAAKWDDHLYRNEMINTWSWMAQRRYTGKASVPVEQQKKLTKISAGEKKAN